MSVRFIERSLFDCDISLTNLAVPVCYEGLPDEDSVRVTEVFKETYPLWYNMFKELEDDYFSENGYWCFSTENVNLVSVPYAILDKPFEFNMDVFIHALKKFEKGYFEDNGIGHCIDELRIPVVQYFSTEESWLDFQEKIEKELFNTRVLFTFCIDSNKCPNRFNAMFTEDKVHGNAYWFKGSSPLGIVGNRPVFIDSPTGELKQYTNILEAIYDYVDFNLLSDTIRPKDHSGFIESTKKDLIEYITTKRTNILPSGKKLFDIVSYVVKTGIASRYNQDEKFKEQIEELKRQRVNQIYYCGYEFPRLLGVDLDMSELSYDVSNIEIKCRNLLGNILTEYLYS